MDRRRFMYNPEITMNISSSSVGNSKDPDVFGPPLWFVLHNAANSYPNRPTPFIQESMKQLVYSLPLLIPCVTCKEHFYDFLRSTNLEEVTSSKENLFNFFVRVHNYVNKRYGRREYSLNEAKELYGFNKLQGSSVRIIYNN